MEKLALQTLRASVEVTLPPRVINKYIPSICHEQLKKSIRENGRFQRFHFRCRFCFLEFSFGFCLFVFSC